MKNGFVAGAIAGVVNGLTGVLFAGLGAQLGLYGIPENIIAEEWVIYWMAITTALGTIFGATFTRMYDSIPREGITKGAIAGLLIWLTKDVSTGIYLGAEHAPVSVIAIIWVGFFMWIGYGLVIGKLYEK